MAQLECLVDSTKKDDLAVIFIHGLNGDARGTWMMDEKDDSTLWPRWLASDVDCSVWVLGYDAKLSSWQDNAMPLPDQGDSVLETLATEEGLKNRPLLLIGHSMGGLVIKTLIHHGRTKGVARYESVVKRIRGVSFVATPHNGSQLATLAKYAAVLLRTNPQVGNMQTHDAHLRSLNQQFLAYFNAKDTCVAVRTFAETRGVLIGKKVLGWNVGGTKLVVDPDSSEPHVPGEIAVRLPEDHSSICKLASKNDQLYKSLLAFIKEDVLPKSQPPRASSNSVERFDSGTNTFHPDSYRTPSTKGLVVGKDPTHVFVSYSWAVEKKTGIVGELQKLCHERGIELVRDENVLRHGELISRFMNELTKGERVITIFSKPYFQSKWCMYELLKIYQRGDFEQRTHPLVADDCDLQDENYRLELVEHWRQAHETAKARLANHDPSVVLDEYKHVNLYRDIYQNINALLNFAAGRLTTSLEDLQANSYDQLLDSIRPLSPVVIPNLLPEVHDANFIQTLKISIKNILTDDAVTIFNNELAEELSKLGIVVTAEASSVASSLIEQMQIADKDVPAIRKVLLNATMECLSKKGRRYADSNLKHVEIREAAEQILGWLVLASVNGNELVKLTPDSTCLPALYFEIPVMTENGVEVIVSRKFQRRSTLQLDSNGADINGCHTVRVDGSRLQWKDSPIVNDIKRMLWNKVFPRAARDTSLSAMDEEKLNTELRIRRQHNWFPEHYYVAVNGVEDCAFDHFRTVYQKLLKSLDQLVLVRFGINAGQNIFMIPEADISGAIRDFLTTINRALAS